jgi:hypothetical protein
MTYFYLTRNQRFPANGYDFVPPTADQQIIGPLCLQALTCTHHTYTHHHEDTTTTNGTTTSQHEQALDVVSVHVHCNGVFFRAAR